MCGRPGCTNEPAKGHRWCKCCKAAYAKEHRKKMKGVVAKREFRRGVEAMRESAVKLFLAMPTLELNGRAIAELIRERQPERST